MAKIGLFGGTFDPIHVGHTRMARAFADELALDTVVFIPAGEPYHKPAHRPAPAQARLDMARLILTEDARFAVSDCDVRRDGPTYTIDTLRRFQAAYPAAQLWWLLGSDSLANLPTWKNWTALFELCRFAVARRHDEPVSEAIKQSPMALARIALLDWPPVDISATAIRAGIHAGDATVWRWLNPEVADYIRAHQLYASPTGLL